MRKIYALLGVAAVFTSAPAATIDGRINLTGNLKSVDGVTKIEQKGELVPLSTQKVLPLRTPGPMKAAVEKKSVILYEDFNNVPDGETEETGPLGDRYVDFIASHYFEPGRYISNEYTPESGTWEGDWVFAGKGGTIILQCYSPQMGATLRTPLGDYSGDITVTVRARCAKTFWGADNEWGYTTGSGASLDLGVMIGGYDGYNPAVTDMPGGYGQMGSGQIYEPDGWQEITFKFRNESPNADGYLMFGTANSIEIDWIKVTDDNTFLPCPAVKGATNFVDDGFTIHWDQVRRSFNYYIDLYKQVYTADSGIDQTWGFDEGSLPEWLTAGDIEYAEEEGVDGTIAVLFPADGETSAITTSDMGMKLGAFSTKVKFQMDDVEAPITLMCDVYGENGWEPFGYLTCDGFWTQPGYWYNLKVDGEQFEDKFTAVRIYADGTSEDNKVFVDDVKIYAKRPFVLERVESEFGWLYDPEDDDYPYNYYYYTGSGKKDDPFYAPYRATSYTFYGLEPETEYWYRVRSHNVSDFSIGEKYHAFGVAAPELLPATDATASSYTANWKDAPKAQKYIVTNYKGTVVEEANPEYSLLVESFPNATGGTTFDVMEPINNTTEGYLDEYTELKGWRGVNNSVGQNMIGAADYSGGYVISPVIMANPYRGSLLVYIEAQGWYGDYLYIQCLKSGYSGPIAFEDDGEEGGVLSGWLEIPAVEGEQIRFSSYNYMGFAITAFEVVQAVEAGDVVRRFDGAVEVPAGQQTYTFSDLDDGVYAYGIVSSFYLEGETALSTSEKFVTVDLASGKSEVTTKVESVISGAEEVERYNVNGVKVGKDYKGVVIVKMNDGTISKKIVR